MSFLVGKVWIFLAVDEEGDEGVVATFTPNGWIPFVATDGKRLEYLRPQAEAIAREHNMLIRLACFEQRTDLEVIDPKRTAQRS